MPADPAAVQAGTLYSAALPTPGGAVASAKVVAPAPASETRSPRGWIDIVHYVATVSLDPPAKSVLLARGSTAVAPIWGPCDQKAVAVMIDLDAVDAKGLAPSSIDAIETIGVTPVYVFDRDAPMTLARARGIAKEGMAAPVDGKTLFLMKPGSEGAVRAMIAARYCVVALIGTHAADFPNAVMPSQPGASPGWFLLPADHDANSN